MEQKERLEKLLDDWLARRREAASIKTTVNEYYKYCEYDINKMSSSSYCEFTREKGIRYSDAVIARRIVRHILVEELGSDESLWPNWKGSDIVLDCVNLEEEAKDFITLSEWEDFSEEMIKALDEINKRGLRKKYLIMCMTWHGIKTSLINKITKDNIAIYDDRLEIKFENETFILDEECAVENMKDVLSYKNQAPYIFQNPSKLTAAQTKELKSKTQSRVVSCGLDQLFSSGMLYRIKQGKKPEVAKRSVHLVVYYEAMSRFLYGEPLSSGELSSSAEPQQTPPDKIDVEKEAKKYIFDWQWERFASQVEAMIDLLRLDRLEPFFEYYLAWNGIPVELISLLTPKNISTNGEDRIYITDGRHEIEIETSKNTALKLQDFILAAGDKVFEEIQGYTDENLPRLFIGARDLGFTNTVEEIYISGILYRLAKFGQEPDDKENLNYYKAVADYMYKGDD